MGTLLDDSERELFDEYASEMNCLSGEEVNYYALDRENTTVDPLYGEPKERVWKGPYRFNAWFQWPTEEPEAGENGFGINFDGVVVISRVDFDNAAAPYPYEDDVIEAWRTPFHDAQSLGVGLFFDVVKEQNDGHIHDSPSFVQFKLFLKRRTQFGAERRVQGP